jgi:Kdo2-lipid IVA lauroyltransferase/acyltransferase
MGRLRLILNFARWLSRIPLGVMHRLGACCGWIAYALAPRYRRMLRANLAQAGFDTPELRRRAIGEVGRAIFELPALWLRDGPALDALVREVDGRDVWDAARAAGHGVIIVAPHLGAFEMVGRWLTLQGPMTALYRPPKLAWLEPLMVHGRTQGQGKLAPTDLSGVRRLLKALRAREVIGMLPDQAPGRGEGEWMDFFGRPAYTMTLLNRLQEGSGATMVLAFAERLDHSVGYRLHLRAMPAPIAGESPTRRLNRAVEDLIRMRPDQYLWSYNRYKVPAGAERSPASGT